MKARIPDKRPDTYRYAVFGSLALNEAYRYNILYHNNIMFIYIYKELCI